MRSTFPPHTHTPIPLMVLYVIQVPSTCKFVCTPYYLHPYILQTQLYNIYIEHIYFFTVQNAEYEYMHYLVEYEYWSILYHVPWRVQVLHQKREVGIAAHAPVHLKYNYSVHLYVFLVQSSTGTVPGDYLRQVIPVIHILSLMPSTYVDPPFS